MVSERMKGLGTARSVIRELFEYGKLRAAQVGEECFRLLHRQPQRPHPRRCQRDGGPAAGEIRRNMTVSRPVSPGILEKIIFTGGTLL